ncbi:MAG: hypothetical protein AB7P03_15035 [Kofleriaceae bacterium]
MVSLDVRQGASARASFKADQEPRMPFRWKTFIYVTCLAFLWISAK